ncbi:MAG: acylphosphatase [Phreatobacter sp.]|uniref:acylphosphatase n=1 Tax=Phreatobacter sp. TaxID=1966341 RepID=UPI002736D4E4|nr:acylphosphatase [Phreatobacter sp.]MDP2800584.1 acylphosphatase [Phreatobacter sp.]
MALHLRIAGIVQGVGYRQWFKRRAEALGVSGWMRNRSDDSVEAVINGAAEAVEALVREAMNGPAGAKVDAIARRAATADEAAAISPGTVEILPTK